VLSITARTIAFCFADKVGIRDAATGELVRGISAKLDEPPQP
jgi:hypothetical protein